MISVIMPVYNSETYLSDTIRSVLQQTYPDFELIIINDGSTDKSLDILQDFALQDNRITIISQKNSGPSKARNTGIAKASGEWIYFMDSDDLIEPQLFEELIGNCDNADMVICGLEKHYEGKLNLTKEYLLQSKNISTPNQMRDYLSEVIRDEKKPVFYNYLWNRIIKAEAIKNNNIRFVENIRLGEDFLFLTEVFKIIHKVNILDQIYYHYFVRGTDSLVGAFYRDGLSQRKIMYDAMKSLYEKYNLYEKCKNDIEIDEGRNLLLTLKKVNYSSCVLSVKDKKQYITEFIQDPYYEFILKYLQKRKGWRNLLIYSLFASRNADLVYLSLNTLGKKR